MIKCISNIISNIKVVKMTLFLLLAKEIKIQMVNLSQLSFSSHLQHEKKSVCVCVCVCLGWQGTKLTKKDVMFSTSSTSFS